MEQKKTGRTLCNQRFEWKGLHPDIWFGNFKVVWEHTWVYADIASAACPSQSGSRTITSITSAAVICDVDESSSINTYCIGSRVVFHNVSSKHNSSFVLLELWLQLRLKSINAAKWTLLLLLESSVPLLWPPFCSWLCSRPKLELSQAFSNACPLLPSHLESSLLAALEIGFLFSERLFQFLSKCQAICDLDVMSFGFLSVSSWTTDFLSEEFRSIM